MAVGPKALGKDPKWEAALALARKAAARPWPVLIRGETGTGKELVARAYHEATKRAGLLVPVNCGAIHHERYEHDLFGHAKGAFTGADKASPGHFRNAHGGTLFLDELGELPMDAQAKLLRVIQEGAVRPVGVDREEAVDVRIVAATHRDLTDESLFRADLRYRLSVCVIELPPLRDRGSDVELLARAFLERDRLPSDPADFDRAALAALSAHEWPGNVRELESVVRHALLRHEGKGTIGVADLGLGETNNTNEPAVVDYVAALAEWGSYRKAAAGLGLKLATFQDRLAAQRSSVQSTYADRTPPLDSNA